MFAFPERVVQRVVVVVDIVIVKSGKSQQILAMVNRLVGLTVVHIAN